MYKCVMQNLFVCVFFVLVGKADSWWWGICKNISHAGWSSLTEKGQWAAYMSIVCLNSMSHSDLNMHSKHTHASSYS